MRASQEDFKLCPSWRERERERTPGYRGMCRYRPSLFVILLIRLKAQYLKIHAQKKQKPGWVGERLAASPLDRFKPKGSWQDLNGTSRTDKQCNPSVRWGAAFLPHFRTSRHSCQGSTRLAHGYRRPLGYDRLKTTNASAHSGSSVGMLRSELSRSLLHKCLVEFRFAGVR